MITVNVHEAKTKLSDLLRRAEHGEVVIICRGGEPVVELRPMKRPRDPCEPDPRLAKVIVHDPDCLLRPMDDDPEWGAKAWGME